MTDTASVTWFDGLTYEQLLYLRTELRHPTDLPDELMWLVFTKWARRPPPSGTTTTPVPGTG